MLSVVTDDGRDVHPETMQRLMAVPAEDRGVTENAPVKALLQIETDRWQSLLDISEQENAEWLDEENDKRDAYADDLERPFEIEDKALEAEIREAKKALRGSNLPMAQKLTEKRRIGTLEASRDRMKAKFHDRRAQIRAEVETMLDRIQESLKIEPMLMI